MLVECQAEAGPGDQELRLRSDPPRPARHHHQPPPGPWLPISSGTQPGQRAWEV